MVDAMLTSMGAFPFYNFFFITMNDDATTKHILAKQE